MTELVSIASWGVASVLARGGKKPKTISVPHLVPVAIESVPLADAPIAVRRPEASEHDRSVIRNLRGRLLGPVVAGEAPVSRSMLSSPALTNAGGIFHIPKPKAPSGSLDDDRWREIVDSGEAEASRAASLMAEQYVVVGDHLYRTVVPPVWTVKAECKSGGWLVSLQVGRFEAPVAGHALRFALSDREKAFSSAGLVHCRLGTAQMVWPPSECFAIDLLQPEIFDGQTDSMFSEDLRRGMLALGGNPAMAVLSAEVRRQWTALRRLMDSGRIGLDAAIEVLRVFSEESGSDRGIEGSFYEFGIQVKGLLAVLTSRTPEDPGEEIHDV